VLMAPFEGVIELGGGLGLLKSEAVMIKADVLFPTKLYVHCY
jgi:hypothetical protein